MPVGLGDGQTRTLDLPSKSDCSGTELSELSEILKNFKLVNQSTIFEWLIAADRWRCPPLHARAARAGPPQGGQSIVNNNYRHLIHELWGNPQNSWRSSTLFLFCFLLFTHSPFTFCNLTGHRCFGAAGAGAGHTRYT